MFIKTLDGKTLLNTERITSIRLYEPEYNQKNYLICASMFQDGGILAEAKTEAEAMKKLEEIYNMVNGK
jgi:hypothetical protein